MWGKGLRRREKRPFPGMPMQRVPSSLGWTRQGKTISFPRLLYSWANIGRGTEALLSLPLDTFGVVAPTGLEAAGCDAALAALDTFGDAALAALDAGLLGLLHTSNAARADSTAASSADH